MARFRPDWRPVAVGSMPHTEPRLAWDVVLRYLSDIPSWPQLPRRSFEENMYVQYSERFPGVVLGGERILVDRDRDLDAGLEALYLAYLENDTQYGDISADYAAGLALLRTGGVEFTRPPVFMKGQVTGPVSWGLTVVDQNRRPVLYDDVLADALAKHLRLKAAWQERELGRFAEQTIVFVDEPYMASFGSAFVSLGREQVTVLLEEVFCGIAGLKGVHCCGNTDWSLLLNTSVDILSLDAYQYADALALYPEGVSAFLERGGVIAWGIVPASPQAESETVEGLVERLEKAQNSLIAKGVPRNRLLEAGLVSPSCGVGSLPRELAERVLRLTAEVSVELRRRYVEDGSVSEEG